MGVTIYDLAREAGVGIGTVSRCLNNHPSVSPGTRARVLAVVKRLSYQPHSHVHRFASKKTTTITAIVPFFTSYFFVEVLQGVQDRAAELGIDMVLYGVDNPAHAEYHMRRSLRHGHVDGLMFFSMKLPEPSVAKLQQMNLPVVLVDTYHDHFDSLLVKNKEGAMKAVQHLLSLGHRNIAMINATLENEPARERLAGYKGALELAGIPFNPDQVFNATIHKQDGFNRDAGYASMKELIKRGSVRDPLTAVFVSSDIQAIGALDAARDLRVRIPEDIAIVSFDDIELARYVQLSTMRQPMYEMGGLALEKLSARMKDPWSPPTLTTFLPELVVRRTCGAKQQPADARKSKPSIELENSPS